MTPEAFFAGLVAILGLFAVLLAALIIMSRKPKPKPEGFD